MRIVVTNDDGVDAPGIAALRVAAMRFGEVTVVAPAGPRSSCGHGFSNVDNLPVRRVAQEGAWCAVDGTPVDCVRLALNATLFERPDLVLSGINQGANVGLDVFPSGTVAAAREAAIHRVPAIAISQYTEAGTPVDWPWAIPQAESVIARILDGEFDDAVAERDGLHWNVNFPLPKDRAESPPCTVVKHDTRPFAYRYEDVSTGDGWQRFRNVTRYRDREAPEGGDVAALFGGAITITPLSLTLNALR